MAGFEPGSRRAHLQYDAQAFAAGELAGQGFRAYVPAQGLSFPILTFSERRIRALYRLRVVPQRVMMD